MAEMNDDELLDALGVEVAPLKVSSRTPREERIIAGFEDILRFYQTHGRAPQHGEDRDIFERLYAVRLDQLRKLPEAQALLAELDSPGLLSGTASAPINVDDLDEDALLAELGIESKPADQVDITVLRHVRSSAEKRAAEEIADRTSCADFDKFQPLFEQVERELKSGVRITRRFGRDTSIANGHFFIVGGHLAYVAEVGDTIKAPNGESDARLRVIYANGTESNLLRRSLQRALYKDETGRRLTDPDMGPLFGDAPEPDDIGTGTIYVLRSLSSHPFIAEHRDLIHKIGVTGGKVEDRIAGAEKDATYLLAGVEIVATYKLHNLSRVRLENLFHRLFGAAQLDLTIEDRFGNPVKPREWFLVPLQVIDEAVQRIRDGSITSTLYDPQSARLISGEGNVSTEPEDQKLIDDDLIRDFFRLTPLHGERISSTSPPEAASNSPHLVYSAEVGLFVRQISWNGPHEPVERWVKVAEFPANPDPALVQKSILRVLKQETYFKSCSICGKTNPVGWMDDDTCHSCMEKNGAVF